MHTGTNGRRVPTAKFKRPSTRSEDDPIDKRGELLAAGMELFASMPYEDVSIEALAQRAEVGHGMVSYHFGSKRGLLAEVVAAVWDDFVRFERPRVDETSPREIVYGFVRRMFEYARRYPERFELMFVKHGDDSVAELFDRAKSSAMREIMVVLGCPEHPSPEFEAAVKGWQGFIEGVIVRWLTASTLDIDDMTEMCVAVLLTAAQATQGILPGVDLQHEVLGWVAGRQGAGSRISLGSPGGR